MTDQPEQVTPKPIQPQHSTEAPCSANVRARIGGYDWQITCRSHVDKDDLINMAKAIKWWNEWLDKNAAPPTKDAMNAINIDHPTVTAATVPTAPTTPATPPQANGNSGGMFKITKMTVTPRSDGKVELAFFESGHQYADIKAIKTPADAAVFLQPTGGWTPQHFAAVSEYPLNCVIDWKPSDNLNKNGKPYKNIVAIKPF